MKTAICVSGLTREVSETWKSFVDNLLINLPLPDVFVYAADAYPADYLDFIKPKKYVVEKQSHFSDMQDILKRIKYIDMGHANSLLQQFYGFKKVWELKKDYEVSNNVSYDIAVRVRPDLIFLKPINLEWFDLTKINIFGDFHYMNVEFAIGQDTAMGHYMKVFDWLAGPGEECLLKDTRRRDENNYGFYNSDLIMRAYLIDNLHISGNGVSKNPYDHYRIMRLHKKGEYQ
jgi:hypothetical protein